MNLFLLMVPIILVVFIGYLSARLVLFSKDSHTTFTRFAFYIAMPCQLFSHLANTPVAQAINIKYIGAFALCVSITGSAIFLYSKFALKKSPAESALNIMGSSQSNTAYFAIPLFILVFNNSSPAIPILIFQVIVLTTIILLIIDHDVQTKKITRIAYVFDILRNIITIIFKTPIIIASLLGIGFSFIHLSIPSTLAEFLKILGSAAAPLALFALGQSLYFDLNKIYRKDLFELTLLTVTKIIIVPLLAWLIGEYLFHLTPFWLASLVIMAAMPSPKNMFIFAVQHKLDTRKSSTVIALTTLLSFISLNILLLLFHSAI